MVHDKNDVKPITDLRFDRYYDLDSFPNACCYAWIKKS